MSSGAEERSRGSSEDLYFYIGEFTKLKSLTIEGILDNVLDRDRFLQNSLSNLEKVELELFTTSRTDIIHCISTRLSQAQQQIVDNCQTYLSLKQLIVWEYLPLNMLQEFIYMKKKFVNLEFLKISRKYGSFWEYPSNSVLDAIISYLFSIPRFKFSVALRISMIVKHFFDVYCKYSQTRHLVIDLKHEGNEGVSFGNYKKLRFGKAKVIAPRMKIKINQEPLDQNPPNQQSIEELVDILKYTGPHLQVFDYHGSGSHRDNTTGGNDVYYHDSGLIDILLQICPNLQSSTWII